ncbi:MAG: LacI family DNA-binding transcriptional regulator [Pseudomonadota bacterium]
MMETLQGIAMARRPTITAVAQAAGVSTATVDRVLNGRGMVRPDTAAKVLAAAEDIGFYAAALIGHRLAPGKPRLRVGFLLQKSRQAFWQDFALAAEDAARRTSAFDARADVTFLQSQSPDDAVRAIEEMAGRVDAIAGTLVSHDRVTAAVDHAQAQGQPCFALLNDFAQGVRQSYIGMNNLKVGRVAAHMVATALTRRGKVAVFVGGSRWHGHALRETGFRSYFRETAPEITVLDTLINLETRQLTYEATLDLLARHPDLAGLYVAGGGMEGALAALREVRAPGDVALVVNELTPDSRAALADGYAAMAIATPLDAVCAHVFEFAGLSLTGDAPPAASQLFLRPGLILPEIL